MGQLFLYQQIGKQNNCSINNTVTQKKVKKVFGDHYIPMYLKILNPNLRLK